MEPYSPRQLQVGLKRHDHTHSQIENGLGSFGVKVQVQGIDGHSFVVLNNQNRSSQGGLEGPFVENYNTFNPMCREQMHFTSSHHSQKRTSSPLLNYQRHPELLRPYDPDRNSLDLDGYRQVPGLTDALSETVRVRGCSSPKTAYTVVVNKARIPLPQASQDLLLDQCPLPDLPSVWTKDPGEVSSTSPKPDINMEHTASVGSLIDMFDRRDPGPMAGRVGFRSRMGREERKRSRSMDGSSSPEPSLPVPMNRWAKEDMSQGSIGLGSHWGRTTSGETFDAVDGREDTKEATGPKNTGTKSQWVGGFVYKMDTMTTLSSASQSAEDSSSERDTQGQQELFDDDTAKQTLFSYLQAGNTENDDITRRKVNLMIEKMHMLRSWKAESLVQLELPDPLGEVQELRDRGAVLESQVTELKQQLEDKIKSGQSTAESCEQTLTEMKKLRESFDRSEQECCRLRQQLTDVEKKLQATLEKLLQVKLEREQYCAEIKDLQEQLSDIHDELDKVKGVEVVKRESILQELAKLRMDFEETLKDHEEQEDMLCRKERELIALRGALEEEMSSHAEDVTSIKERYEQEIQKLQTATEEATQSSSVLGEEKAEAEAERGTALEKLGQLSQERDLLSRQVQELENKVANLNSVVQEARVQENKLKDRMNKLMEEKVELEQTLSEVRQQEEDLCGSNRALTIHLEDTQCKLTKLCHEHKDLKLKLRVECSHVEDLRQKKNDMEEERKKQDRVMEQLHEEMSTVVEESERATKRLQVQIDKAREQSLRDLNEANRQLQEKQEELEKQRLLSLRLQKELSQLESELRHHEKEMEEMELKSQKLEKRVEEQENMNRSTQDEKIKKCKFMEARICQLERDLNEERSGEDLLIQRLERNKEQMEQVRAELLQESATRQELECDKISLERQNKDLKSRVTHLEGSQKFSQDGLVSKLEARVHELEARLEGEERDNNNLQQANRKLERKVKEMMMQVDEDQISLKNQRDQLNLRLRSLKRQLDEAEEEIERLENSKKRIQRELDEQQEINQQLKSQLSDLRTEMRRKQRPTSLLKALDEDEDDDEGDSD
ncbi:cingulin-like protein 1 isoform X2 [Denticeps clupeoides]|uniref:cingulin-like protein 1 isoform X2 n=1 Tax=Denticeps clupeoides TaxID=299321 RepID=UPI0010A48AA5|nr:cingulin-like protein 1 isoform X2 [Denticeps clupeoides]